MLEDSQDNDTKESTEMPQNKEKEKKKMSLMPTTLTSMIIDKDRDLKK